MGIWIVDWDWALELGIVLRWGLGFGIGNGGLRFRIGDWYWGLLLGKQRGDKDWLLFVILVLEC